MAPPRGRQWRANRECGQVITSSSRTWTKAMRQASSAAPTITEPATRQASEGSSQATGRGGSRGGGRVGCIDHQFVVLKRRTLRIFWLQYAIASVAVALLFIDDRRYHFVPTNWSLFFRWIISGRVPSHDLKTTFAHSQTGVCWSQFKPPNTDRTKIPVTAPHRPVIIGMKYGRAWSITANLTPMRGTTRKDSSFQ